MEKNKCDFCRYGEEVSDVCGKLHVEKIAGGKVVAAHHKCMQYSAGLIQYKFDHFGGFKIDKVQEELKRGTHVKCAICKLDRKRQKQQSRATSGCAVKFCRKSFHYYCAKISDKCITKRMLVRYKQSDQEVVMYRVFCCKEHEQHFKKNKQDLVADPSAFESDSDVSDDVSNGDEDSIRGAGQSSDGESLDVNSDEMLNRNGEDLLMTTLHSPQLQNGMNSQQEENDNKELDGQNDNEAGELENEEMSSQKSADWQPTITSVQSLSNDRIGPPQSSAVCKLFADDVDEGNSGESSSVGFDYSEDHNTTSFNNTEEVKNKKDLKFHSIVRISGKDKKSAEDQKRVEQGRKKNESEEDKFGSKENKNDKHYPDVYLVLTDDVSCKQATKSDFTKQLETHCQVLFWPKNADAYAALTKEHMPYLFSDVVNFLREPDLDALIKLLTDKDRLNSQLYIHNYALKLHNTMEPNIVQLVQTSFMKTLEKSLEDFNSKFEVDIVKLLTASNGSKAVAVFINKDVDPHSRLRSSLGYEEKCNYDLHSWLYGMPTFVQGSALERENESFALTRWIISTIGHEPEVLIYPIESFLEQQKGQSVSNLVGLQLSKAKIMKRNISSGAGAASNAPGLVVCICRMDTQVINYKPFCLKCIKKYVEDRDQHDRQVVFVIDIVDGEFESVNQMVPDHEDFMKNHNVQFLTAFSKPSQGITSTVLIHISKAPATSQQEKSSRKSGVSEASPGRVDNNGEVRNVNKESGMKKRLRIDMSPSRITLKRSPGESPGSGNQKRKRTA